MRRKKINDGIKKVPIKRKLHTIEKKNFSSYREGISSSTKKQIRREKKISDNTHRVVSHQYPEKLKKKKREYKDFFSRNKKIIKWIFLIFIFLGFIAFIAQKNEKTIVTITPRKKHISETEKITASLYPKFNELGFGIIALSDSRTKIVEPKNRVRISQKASGKITIFNNYSTEPQKLSPFTRFQSVSGMIFKLGESGVVIPGKTADKPGKVEAMVYAEQAGPQYNIDVTDFSIPGFKESGLTEKYHNIYALSLQKFTGGEDGFQLVLNEKQKEDSKEILESELKEVLIKRMEKEKTDKVLIVDNSIQILFKEPSFKKLSDNTYLVKQDAQIFAVFIEKKQLEKFLKKKYLSNSLEEDAIISDFNNISFNYTGDEIDYNNLKSIPIDAHIDTYFVWNIDKSLVQESLVGLKKEDVLFILRELDEIERAHIDINPFWQNHISHNLERVIINVLSPVHS